jgi:hypothetical protein
MRILSLTTLALIGLAGVAFAADQVPDRQHGNPSECFVSAGHMQAKAGKPCYDREQTNKADKQGPILEREGGAAGSPSSPNDNLMHTQMADSEKQGVTGAGKHAEDDQARDRDRVHERHDREGDEREWTAFAPGRLWLRIAPGHSLSKPRSVG